MNDILFYFFIAIMLILVVSTVIMALFAPYYRRAKGLPINWSQLRRQAIKRANRRCEECGSYSRYFHVHHIVARRQNGSNDLGNLKVLCPNCHLRHHPNNRKLKGLVRKQIRGFVSEEEIRRQLMDEALEHAKMYEA